jgi:hypothetical protein
MTREDIVNNLLSTYAKHGVPKFLIEHEIDSGLKDGFSYQTIYTGLRMAMGKCFKEEEHFTPAEMAEALGTTEEEIMRQIETSKKELIEQGKNAEEYFTEIKPEGKQRFVIMPGGLK